MTVLHKLQGFFEELRLNGVPITPSNAMDCCQAVLPRLTGPGKTTSTQLCIVHCLKILPTRRSLIRYSKTILPFPVPKIRLQKTPSHNIPAIGCN